VREVVTPSASSISVASISRTPPVCRAAPGGEARTLGAEIEQAPAGRRTFAQLREKEAAPIAEIGIVHAELVAVIAQRQRLGLRVRQRFEPTEMCQPLRIAQRVEADGCRRAVVAETQDMRRKIRRLDRIGDEVGDFCDRVFGLVITCWQGVLHGPIWGPAGERIKLGRL
jgi:hypothetical protein